MTPLEHRSTRSAEDVAAIEARLNMAERIFVGQLKREQRWQARMLAAAALIDLVAVAVIVASRRTTAL